jgi:hypothetical protein
MTLKDLSEMDWKASCAKHPSMPPDYVVRNKFSDKTANDLEKAICKFITLSGGQAERIKNMGRYLPAKRVKSASGATIRIGKDKYIPGTGTNGTPDVHSTIPVTIAGHKIGLKVTWEIKIGKDTIKENQLEYAKELELAGGRAYFVRSWDDFYKKYSELLDSYK